MKLPVERLQNATTYAFRFTVTDCARSDYAVTDVLFPGCNNRCPAGDYGWPVSGSGYVAGIADLGVKRICA